MAAGIAGNVLKIRNDVIREALMDFQGVEHRLETVMKVHGINFINDSKATNVDAVIRALESFSKPVVLIMGGLDKGSNFKELREILPKHAKKLIVMGKAAARIQSALGDTIPTTAAVSMADAVKQAYRVVSPDNVILLSPGCASFDMYDNYVQRGEDFKKTVENIKLQLS